MAIDNSLTRGSWQPNGVRRAHLRLYEDHVAGETVSRLCIAVRNLTSHLQASLLTGELALAERTLRRLDHHTVRLAFIVPRSELEATAKRSTLELVLQSAGGWRSATSRAIVSEFRAFDSVHGRDADFVYEGHEARRVATEIFEDRLQAWCAIAGHDGGASSSLDGLNRLMIVAGHIQSTQYDLDRFEGSGDRREDGCRNYLSDRLSLFCSTPTHDRHDSEYKVGYLQILRQGYRGRDARTYLMLNAAIEHEIARWEPGMTFDNGFPEARRRNRTWPRRGSWHKSEVDRREFSGARSDRVRPDAGIC